MARTIPTPPRMPGQQPLGQVVYISQGLFNGIQANIIARTSSLTSLAFDSTASPLQATVIGQAALLITRASDGAILLNDSSATLTLTATDAGRGSGDSLAVKISDHNDDQVVALPLTQLLAGNIVINPS
jgi:hypothetical protein